MANNCCPPFQIYNTTKTLSFQTSNTFVGKNALKGRNGNENSAFGSQALGGGSGDNTGSRNTAIGRGASYNNTTGERNTAVGFDALNNNQTGILNTAVGSYALVQLVSGEDNTAFGREALANLGKITEEGKKTFYNTAIGSNAGVNLGLKSTQNQNMTFLGANSDVESESTPYSNSTAVGASSLITKSDQLVLGTSSVETYIPGTLTINRQNIKNNELTISDENGNKYKISLTPVN